MSDSARYQDDDPEPLEAYCVRCKQMTVMENAVPVWTRRGAPGMRGECEMCGTTLFRMGRTEAHRGLVQPDTSQFRQIAPAARRHNPRSAAAPYAAYINFAAADSGLATRLAADLTRTGIPVWFEDARPAVTINWASGVHPALEDCSHMIVVLSPSALRDQQVQQSWAFFRQRRKPIVVALAESVAVPDELRRSPRVDFSVEYKAAFRELVQAISG